MERRRVLAVLVGLSAVLAGTAGAVLMLRAATSSAVWDSNSLTGCMVAAAYGATGAYVARARPGHPVGWVLLWVAVTQAAAGLGSGWAQQDLPGTAAAAWVSSWIWFLGFAPLPTFLLALYPTGAASARRRALLLVSGLGSVLVAAALAVSPGAIDDIAKVQHPFPVPAAEVPLAVAGAALLLPCVLLCLLDAARRLWRAQSPEREQLAWLLTAVLLAVGTSYLPLGVVNLVLHVLLPVAIGVGVVRHRLLDLQVVVRRTLVFVCLTAVVVLVFVLTTSVASSAVQGGPLPVAVAAALVAVGLNPVRERVQRAVDRLVYGDRRDPVRAVSALGSQVQRHGGEQLVPQVLATLASAVRSPHVALLAPEGEVADRVGTATRGAPLRLPLTVGGDDVGCLLVAPRTPREGWSRADLDLLEVLTPQVAVVVHAQRLFTELASSRDRVLSATAEERQRLRQELHDGLGPALAGIALGLEAAEVSLPGDPVRAADLLARLRAETQAAGREVRLLVEGLRPGALQELDLADALRAYLDGLRPVVAGRLELALELPEPLPPLPPDVDAAAYRIVTEAVTNVMRHSGARRCEVRVTADVDGLHVVVEDDGNGLPRQPQPGVGLTSMRRRASALGGCWEAESRPGGGTRVAVDLPARAGLPA